MSLLSPLRRRAICGAILALSAALATGSCGSAPKRAEPGDVGATSIEGTWHGVVLEYPGLVQLELRVEAPEGAETRDGSVRLPATLRTQSLAAYLDDANFDRAGDHGTAAVTVVLDPVHDVFSIERGNASATAGRADRGRTRGGQFPGGRVGQLFQGNSGLLARQSGHLVLLSPSPRSGLDTAVSLVRPGEFERVAKNFQSLQRRGGGGAGLFSSAPSDAKLRKWAAPLLERSGGAQPHQMVSGEVERAAIMLFDDDYFEGSFGKPFDELSVGSLGKITASLRGMVGRRATDADMSMAALHRLFWPHVGSPSATQTLQGVYALRGVIGWLASRQAQLEGEGDRALGWDEVQATLRLTQTTAGSWVLPDRLAAVEAAADKAFTRIAYPSLQEDLERLARAPADAASRQALVSFAQAKAGRLHFVTSAQRIELLSRASGLHDASVAAAVDNHTQALQDLGSGLPAVLRGNEWVARFQSDLATASRMEPYRQTLELFLKRRAADLAGAEAEMLNQIEGAAGDRLGQLPNQWFRAPGDGASPTKRAVDQALEARKRQLAAEYEANIAAAEAAARAEVESRPGQPLRFIDFRKYPSGEFLSFIYYGVGDNKTQQDLLELLGTSDIGAMYDIAKYVSKMKLAFSTYHDFYYRRYGDAEAKIAASGVEWRGMHRVTNTLDQWGNVIHSRMDPEPFVLVRRSFAEAYKKTLADGMDAVVAIVGALVHAGSERGRESDVHDRFAQHLFGNLLRGGRDFEQAYGAFLDDFKESHPATVAHFEENLRRAFELESLREIRRLTPAR